MSVVLSMTAVAVVAGISLSQVSLAAIVSAIDNKHKPESEGLETVFTDADLLCKTLKELDCHTKVVSENEIYVETTNGQLCYRRENSSEAFNLYLNDINNVDGLIEEIRSFEVDYGRNVQDYTYHHIKDNLEEGMSIENETVDNDELVLTINVE